MTVAELIEKLSNYPSEAVVEVDYGEDVFDVEHVVYEEFEEDGELYQVIILR